MSSFLFQLAISHLFQELRTRFTTILSYLDDNAAPSHSLKTLHDLLEALHSICPKFGLVLNSKTALVGTRSLTQEELDSFPLFGSNITEFNLLGSKMLGGFVGSPKETSRFITKSFTKIAEKINIFTQVIKYSKSREYLMQPHLVDKPDINLFYIPSPNLSSTALLCIHLIRVTRSSITRPLVHLITKPLSICIASLLESNLMISLKAAC